MINSLIYSFHYKSTKRKREVESVSCSAMSDSATPWTVARQALLSVGFSRQEFWSGLPFPSPGDLPNLDLLHCRQILDRVSYEGGLGRDEAKK